MAVNQGTTVAWQQNSQQGPINNGPQSSGQFRGEQVTQIPIRGVRAEAESSLEELTFKADLYKQENDRKKLLPQRKFGVFTPPIKSENSEQGNNYLKLFNSADKLTLRNLMARINRLVRPSISQLRRLASQAFSDVSLQYAALDIIRAELKRRRVSRKRPAGGLGDELEGNIEEAMEQLMAEEGPAVRAGLNIVSVTSQFANPSLGNAQHLRNFYRDSVLNYGGITDTYRGVIAKYGEQNFTSSLAFLLRALGVDMAAQESSRDPARLRAIVNDMFCVKTLGGIHEQTGEFVDTLRHHHNQTDCPPGQQLMSELLNIKDDNWPQAKRFFDLVTTMRIHGHDKVVYFLQHVKTLIRLIPLKAYDEPEMRDKLQAASQEAIDEAIIREEEALE